MNVDSYPRLRDLNHCGCCQGIGLKTPMEVRNRPGLNTILYRVGTHPQFKHSMLTRLSSSKQPALAGLTTRDDDDFSITLVDAWATIADVLTFYQERMANEGYLRTATERLSLLELARLIGYELNPGVAAGTYLAFTLDDIPGAFGEALTPGANGLSLPPPIIIGAGTKVQSVPGPDEQAQIFETVEEIESRPGWNTIKPRLTEEQTVSVGMSRIILHGTGTNLEVGGKVLIVEKSGAYAIRRIVAVMTDDDSSTTQIDLLKDSSNGGTKTATIEFFDSSLPSFSDKSVFINEGKISDFPDNTKLDDSVVTAIIGKRWQGDDLLALARIQGWSEDELTANIAQQTEKRPVIDNVGVFAFRQRAAVFGHNAPKQPDYPGGIPTPPSEWDEWCLETDETSRKIFLDTAYDGIIPESYIAIEKPGEGAAIHPISQVTIRPRTAYGISSQTTELTLENEPSWWTIFSEEKPSDLADFRDITVYVQSERLDLAEAPIQETIHGDRILLNGVYLGLTVGQNVMLTGERDDLNGVTTSELMTIEDAVIVRGVTELTLARSLTHPYIRDTVVINANVAEATHGESVEEILGSGDARQPFQRFTLKQPPLTYISASVPSGSETTLEVRVNEVLWHEVSSFFDRDPEERIYVTRVDDEGNTTVIFGDGRTGARLPTGVENIKVKYRKGIGLSGRVKVNQLSQLMTRPLGVKGVTNPMASSGAADREGIDDARRNAPLQVLTLGRIVSVQDYQDFARAFAGIDKALATWSWNGQRRQVFVTVAGSEGAIVGKESTLYENLLVAMRDSGDPRVALEVASFQPRFFQVAASVQVHADFLPEIVKPAIEERLREHFSFEAREFGQPVALSEVMAIMQNVRGVISVDVDQFYRSDRDVDKMIRIDAAIPRPGGDNVFAAELLTLDPLPIGLEVNL